MSTATIVTNKGSFSVTLMPEHAPKTVQNFVDLATGGREWTDPRTARPRATPCIPGTIFHRVIDGFMIQGGDPTGTGMGGPGYTFEDECPPDGPTFNQVGRLAMANAGPGHERLPVLRDRDRDPAPQRSAHDLRSGDRRATTWWSRSRTCRWARRTSPSRTS